MKAQGRERELKAKARMRAIGMVVAVAVLALMSVIVMLVLRSSRRTKKINAMISAYNAEITEKNDKISMQNAVMTDSINYASIIQIAAMPSKEEMENIFGDNLVWLKPRNVVSGDFFWTMDAERYKLLVVGDCTGHGVPGALLSMLGMSILDYMTRHFGTGDIQAAPLLDRMRRYFKRTLNQKSYRTDVAIDSIDLALLVIDTETGLLQYTAAFRPLLIFRNGMPIKMRADSMPIGVYPKEKEHFTNNEIQLCKGDIIYLYSDGFTDQTGYESVLSPIARAYTSKRFINFLQKIHTLPFAMQYEKLNSEFEWWRSSKSPAQALCEQTDDNIVVGVAVNNFMNLPD
jgi:serine phosphatase RsbU (regulator of sigma subunit)